MHGRGPGGAEACTACGTWEQVTRPASSPANTLAPLKPKTMVVMDASSCERQGISARKHRGLGVRASQQVRNESVRPMLTTCLAPSDQKCSSPSSAKSCMTYTRPRDVPTPARRAQGLSATAVTDSGPPRGGSLAMRSIRAGSGASLGAAASRRESTTMAPSSVLREANPGTGRGGGHWHSQSASGPTPPQAGQFLLLHECSRLASREHRALGRRVWLSFNLPQRSPRDHVRLARRNASQLDTSPSGNQVLGVKPRPRASGGHGWPVGGPARQHA